MWMKPHRTNHTAVQFAPLESVGLWVLRRDRVVFIMTPRPEKKMVRRRAAGRDLGT